MFKKDNFIRTFVSKENQVRNLCPIALTSIEYGNTELNIKLIETSIRKKF